MIKIGVKSIIIQDGKMINDSLLSSGTKAGFDIASIVSSIKLGANSLYLMINELFFTTHDLDILDLSLCKHSFNDDQGISIVNAATYLR